jgi:hypothetical protein
MAQYGFGALIYITTTSCPNQRVPRGLISAEIGNLTTLNFFPIYTRFLEAVAKTGWISGKMGY